MNVAKNAAREIAGPDARIKRHGLFNPIYSVTTEPSLLDTVYGKASEYALPIATSVAIALGSLSVGTNTAIAEELDAKPPTKPHVPTVPYEKNHFPFPKTLATKIDAEYQPDTDSSRLGFSLAEIGEDGRPVFGDWLRVYRDIMADGTAQTNAGVRVPFDFGHKGELALYGMENKDDDGMGARLSGCYGDWLLKGAFERLELGGDEQELNGLGLGKIIDSDLGRTQVELWVYDKNGKNFGNLLLFQNFKNG